MLQLNPILISLFIRFALGGASKSSNLLNHSKLLEPLESLAQPEELRTIRLPSRVVTLLVDLLQPDRLSDYLSSNDSTKIRPLVEDSKLMVNAQIAASNQSSANKTKTGTTLTTSLSGLMLPTNYVAPVSRKENCSSSSDRLEVLLPMSYADDSVGLVNLSHGFIYRLDSEAFVGQHFKYIDLSYNRLGVVHANSFLIGPMHSPSRKQLNSSSLMALDGTYSSKPLAYLLSVRSSHSPVSITIDFSYNPFIVAMPGAFDHIDVPRSLLNFSGTQIEFKFAAFKKYLMAHPGHLIDADQVDCCGQEWLFTYRNNFLPRTRCAHDLSLVFNREIQRSIIESCVKHMISGGRNSLISQPEPSIIHQVAASIMRYTDTASQRLNYLLLGGTAMVLSLLSIYVIFYMLSFKAAFDDHHQMQQHKG